jgi:hypothetical protein
LCFQESRAFSETLVEIAFVDAAHEQQGERDDTAVDAARAQRSEQDGDDAVDAAHAKQGERDDAAADAAHAQRRKHDDVAADAPDIMPSYARRVVMQ